MKFSKESIENAIDKVSMVIKGVSTIPALDYIKVYWKDEHAYFMATNIQITMVSKFPHEDQFEDFLLNAEKMKSIVKLLKNDLEVDIITVDGHVTIKQGKSKYNLSSVPAADYPMVVHNDNFAPIGKFTKGITKALAGALKFTGNDELRPAMNGVFVTSDDDKKNLYFAATDAHKLVEYTLGFEVPNGFNSFIIPAKALNISTKVYKDEYNVSVSEKKIMFTDNIVTMIITMIDSKFPSYKAVIPTDNPNSFEVDSNEFLSILRQVSVVRSTANTIKIHLEGAFVVLDSENSELGNSSHAEMMGVLDINENEFNIGYNMGFLEMMIKELTQPTIKFEFSTPNRATVIHDECDEYSLLGLVMPVMITD